MINKLNECLDENKEFSQLVDLINNSIENDNKNIFVLEKLLIILMVTKLEVFLEDERLTTVQATNLLIKNDTSRKKRKEVVDSMAATIILQSFLDKNKKEK